MSRLILSGGMGAAALMLVACETTTRDVRAPNLSYIASMECMEAVSFENPVTRSNDEKTRKSQMRKRTIELSKDMADDDIACVTDDAGIRRPYVAFEIPTGMTGRVVSTGSKIDTAVVFAGDIATYDAEGNLVRDFESSEYRRLGSLYGVQFSPRDNERFVLIQADPALVGNRDATVETSTQAQNVTIAYGTAVGGGTNTVGIQQTYDRTYSYNGEVVLRTVFPKQADE